MLARLRHRTVVGRDHQQCEVDTRGPGQHVANQLFVAGVTSTKPISRRRPAAAVGIAEVERDAARLFRQTIGVDAGQRPDQRGLCRGRCGLQFRQSCADDHAAMSSAASVAANRVIAGIEAAQIEQQRALSSMRLITGRRGWATPAARGFDAAEHAALLAPCGRMAKPLMASDPPVNDPEPICERNSTTSTVTGKLASAARRPGSRCCAAARSPLAVPLVCAARPAKLRQALWGRGKGAARFLQRGERDLPTRSARLSGFF